MTLHTKSNTVFNIMPALSISTRNYVMSAYTLSIPTEYTPLITFDNSLLKQSILFSYCQRYFQASFLKKCHT